MIPRVDLLLRVLEDDDDKFQLTRMLKMKSGRGELYEAVHQSLLVCLPGESATGTGIQAWGETDYMQALRELAAARDMTLSECARRFGTVTLPDHEAGWRFHPALGFSKRR